MFLINYHLKWFLLTFITVALSLDKISDAYSILKDYSGDNPYILNLKNNILVYGLKTMNDLEASYIIRNHDRKPTLINKVVKIADWWGYDKMDELGLDFAPTKMKITWFLGETKGAYHVYCIFRKSQERATELFVPKKAVLTNFLIEDYNTLDIDLTKYNTKERSVMPHQVEAVKFLLSRKKCILADEMGGGKTFSAILAALEGHFRHVLVICPSSVKKAWENELKCVVDENEITIVSGSEWKDNRFNIINYDILDNFYKVPTQVVKKKELNVDDNGNVVTELKEKEIVSRNRYVIEDAMSKSQLFKANYDLVIIDEAHRLSNSTSGRFKIISDLLKRSKPSAIFELTGTMITNSSKNLYNLLKIIDIPITYDWRHYMERYCGAKVFYKKSEREAYTAMFCHERDKKEWRELSYDEKRMLDELLEKKCKKIVIPGEDTNMEELQEIIKPYYLRRLKSDFKKMVRKDIRMLHYEMTPEEKESYDELWEKYLELQDDKEKSEKNKKLIETTLMRQWLADKMIPRTISLADKCIGLGHKVIIFCAYDNEIKQLTDAFGDKCVFHNGKINEKKKNQAVEEFQNNPEVKVFIGNIFSAGVGLSLTAGTVCIFNNFSFVPGDCWQCEDRIHRLNQTRACTIYYQSFNGTYYDKMLEIIHDKETVINKIVITEKEK